MARGYLDETYYTDINDPNRPGACKKIEPEKNPFCYRSGPTFTVKIIPKEKLMHGNGPHKAWLQGDYVAAALERIPKITTDMLKPGMKVRLMTKAEVDAIPGVYQGVCRGFSGDEILYKRKGWRGGIFASDMYLLGNIVGVSGISSHDHIFAVKRLDMEYVCCWLPIEIIAEIVPEEQPAIPESLKAFLEENGALDNYMENLDPEFDFKGTPANGYILCILAGDFTKQGYEYWDKIDSKWLAHMRQTPRADHARG